MKHKESKLINIVANDLIESLNNLSWSNYGDRLIDLTLEESKNHNKWGNRTRANRGISVQTEARYFAIKRIIECLDGYTPDSKEFLFLQRSVFAAYCIATNERFKEPLSAWLTRHESAARLIASWDYCDLIQPTNKGDNHASE